MVCAHSLVFMPVALMGYCIEHKGLRCCDKLELLPWLHTYYAQHTQYKNTEHKEYSVMPQSCSSRTPLLMVRARVTTDPPNS